MKSRFSVVVSLAAVLFAATSVHADSNRRPLDPAGIERLVSESDGKAKVSIARGTNAVRFINFGAEGFATPGAPMSTPLAHAAGFLARYKSIFGIADLSALNLSSTQTDAVGDTHLSYQQMHRGVPVFAGVLRVHIGAGNRIKAVNGTTVPGIFVNATPTVSNSDASSAAVAYVLNQPRNDNASAPRAAPVAQKSTLMIYRTGLVQGTTGGNHLAYEVEVSNGVDIREFVYVDAHSGAILDRISGQQDAINRVTYDGPTNYTNNVVYWNEGMTFPSADAENDNVVNGTGQVPNGATWGTYDLFAKAVGRDSYDNAGASMKMMFRRASNCPNAYWNGAYASFCPGVSSDDIVGHEWGHAYTQYTHGLIYAWQPGALNESYSDIIGETVDLLNLIGTDLPNTVRTSNCSLYTRPLVMLRVNTPTAIAGDKDAGGAVFGPSLTLTGTTGNVVLVDDGSTADTGGTLTDGCQTPFANAAAVAGNIVLIDRGVCNFVTKVKNAEANGAIAVIVGNNLANGDAVYEIGPEDTTIGIPSVIIGYTNTNAIKAQLINGVNTTLRATTDNTEDSYRWLMAEDSPSWYGAIRDMANPACYGDPGKVSDAATYHCGTGDNGGVHSNSGIPNHAYALLVDGGSYNGQTITGIGLTKAMHIYIRAMSVYQVPNSDFADHADALEASAQDLLGVNLLDLVTGAFSGQVINANDILQLQKALLATEMRTEPQCNFQPLLAQNPPASCGVNTAAQTIYTETFEAGLGSWTATMVNASPTATPRNWVQDTTLPDGRAGAGALAISPGSPDCMTINQAAVLRLESPAIVLPLTATVSRISFWHYVVTQPGYDGGNVKISINGGPFVEVATANYIYNAPLTPVAVNNPLAPQKTWSGTDGGQVDGGTWGQTQINLSPYAAAGDTVRIRFEFGTNGCGGSEGWYLDDVRVFACNAIPSGINVSATTLNTSESGGTASFTVTLNNQPSAAVTIPVSTGDSSEGTVDRSSLTFTSANYSTAQTVTVTAVDDFIDDGDIVYSIILGAATSTDPAYSGADPADISVTNADNDGANILQAQSAISDAGGNGVVEANEPFVFQPTWLNAGSTSLNVIGALTNFTGPGFPVYQLLDGAADYGTVAAGTEKTCNDCYTLNINSGARPALTHWDATVDETVTTTPASTNDVHTWTIHVGDSFTDAPQTNLFYRYIETLLHNEVTFGCTGTTYCPSSAVSRAAMAAFVSRAMAGGDANVPSTGTVGATAYNCSANGNSLYTDVAPTNTFCRYIHYISARNVTLGCTATTFCPSAIISRSQLAAFIARAVAGNDASVPMAYTDDETGRSYNLNGNSNVHFSDMVGHPFSRHAHYLWARGIIYGCGVTTYCPNDSATRESMSEFLVNGFNLTLD